MENASKALVIAGGILLGIIVISLFMYMFNNASALMDSTSENTEESELLRFNQGFHIYNKQVMYGTDVISAINKAIDNNRRYKTQPGDSSGNSVNIIFNLKTPLNAIEETHTIQDGNWDRITDTKVISGASFTAGQHSLQTDLSTINTALLDASKYKDNEKGLGVKRQQITAKKYKLTIYPLAEFKRRSFACENIDYSPKTGRVMNMYFVEK